MVKIEKYTGNKTYMYPNGALATPDTIKNDFPAVEAFVHIIETDEAGQVCFAVQNLAAVRSQMAIDSSLSEDEAIAKIEELRNAPIPEPDPTAEERIEAALEYQNLANM
ncbi:rNA binding protein Jsn1 putative [Clostridium sp. CAG:557]|jgi:hypothetical protein|nr:rNA binding protein Jsn1 putative [Clostridium sp. CAG:557]